MNLLDDRNPDVESFIDTLCSHSVFPTITLPARIVNNKNNGTLIDNIFTSSLEFNIESGNLLVGISDHLPQFALFEKIEKTQKMTDETFYKDWGSFKKEDFLEDFRKVNWRELLVLDEKDPSKSMDIFFKELEILINNHVSVKRVTKKQSKSKPWITRDIKRSIAKRDKLLLQYKKHKDFNNAQKENLLHRYREERNRIVKLIRSSKQEYYKNFFEENIRNSRNIWKGARQLIKTKNKSDKNVITLNINESIVTDSLRIANEFNHFFTNIANKIKETIPTSNDSFKKYLKNPMRDSFFFAPCTGEEIIDIFNKIDTSKSSGPNSIPKYIIKTALTEISMILSQIFNISFETGKFPNTLKIAKIIPIYKNKGSETEVSNYRPIALLSNIDKVFEKLVHKRLISYLENNSLIFSRQFGFRSKHSTKHALITLTEKIRAMLDKGNFACSVFLDLQKAFDTVDHAILLGKLKHYGVRGVANEWFRSYLSDRKQFVFLQGSESEMLDNNNGVPQGSVLGPLLFLIYINDLQNAISDTEAYIFADDTAIATFNKELKQIETKLNKDLTLLTDWLHLNKIALNVAKTQAILFRHAKKKTTRKIELKICGQKIVFATTTKYLGLILDENLTWKPSVDDLACKLRRTNGIIAKLRHYTSIQTLKSFYYALFYSQICYAIQVWGQAMSHGHRIVKLQKIAARLMTFSAFNCPSSPLLKRLGFIAIRDLVFLENILLVYKTLKNEVPLGIKHALEWKYINNKYNTRGQEQFLLKRKEVSTSTFGISSISYQSIIHWNSLQNIKKNNRLTLSFSKIKAATLEFLSSYLKNNIK